MGEHVPDPHASGWAHQPDDQTTWHYGPSDELDVDLPTVFTIALPPGLADLIIDRLSRPTDTVVDVSRGPGLALAAAARSGRAGIGIVPSPEWAGLCTANLDVCLPAAQRPLAQVRFGSPATLPSVLSDVAGTVGLVVATLRGPSERAFLGLADFVELSELAEGAWTVLRPGGLLGIVMPTDEVDEALVLATVATPLPAAGGLVIKRRITAQPLSQERHPTGRVDPRLDPRQPLLGRYRLLVFAAEGGAHG